MKDLLLITNGFPYGKGEAFLEEEIKFLSKSFNRIEIVSLKKSDGITRPMPNNVNSVEFKTKLNSVTFFKSILIALVHIRLISAFIRSEIGFINRTKDIPLNIKVLFYLVNDLQKGLLLFNFIKKLQVISRAHRGDIYFEHTPRKYISFQTIKAQILDEIVFISEDGLEYFKNKIECMEPQLRLSKLGIRIPERVDNWELNSRRTIVSCSALVPVKRIHKIIDALSLVKEYNINWIHIGDGVLLEELKHYAIKKLEDKTNIDFCFKGSISNKEVHQFYNDTVIDLFINLSSSEGLPVSIMEVMGYCIPVIATNVGGTKEIVNKNNGFLVEADSSSQLIVDCINEIFSKDSVEYKKMRFNAFKTASVEFNAVNNYTIFANKLASYKLI